MSHFEDLAIPFALAIFGWWQWYAGINTVTRLASPFRLRLPLLVMPICCALLLLVVLRFCASGDVRDDPVYLVSYLLLGAGWTGIAALAFPFLGISARDDVIERRNTAASWPVNSALLGVTLCFAGANIGDGPGPQVVVFCALLSTGSLLFFWLGLELIASTSEAITVERDMGTSVRLAGFLVALGILFGNAIAGSWTSASETLRDFFDLAWPAVVLFWIAVLVERTFKRQADLPARRISASLAIAVVYIVAAAAWAAVMGDWS